MSKIHITFVMDRSQSMSTCTQEAQDGLNKFVKDQRTIDENTTFTLVQFDHEYELVYDAEPLKDVGEYIFTPRGSTALLDAIGRAISYTNDFVRDENPDQVLFVIFTDGQENCSQELNREQVRQLIEDKTNNAKWQFVYMGANQDAFSEAQSLGVGAGNAVNYVSSRMGMTQAFDAISSSTRSYSAKGLAQTDCYFNGANNVDDLNQ